MCIQHLADTYFKTNKSFARQTLDTFTYNNEKILLFYVILQIHTSTMAKSYKEIFKF